MMQREIMRVIWVNFKSVYTKENKNLSHEISNDKQVISNDQFCRETCHRKYSHEYHFIRAKQLPSCFILISASHLCDCTCIYLSFNSC